MQLNKSLALLFIVLISLISGGFLTYRFFSEATCGFLHPGAVANMKSIINSIESYRAENGRLPAEPKTVIEVFTYGHYRILDDGSYEIRHMGFDGPSISYSENTGRWQCGL